MMRGFLVVASLWLAIAVSSAHAMDLIDAWRSALQHDLDFAAAYAAHQAGEARRAQGEAPWRPTVQVTGTAGRMTSETATNGAQFSAPGFPQSDGVNFNTSINNGALGRWMVEARQPLVSGERLARKKRLDLSADISELEWQGARQTLMLTTAQRYFDVALADESLRVLRQQQCSVESALRETQDRHALGDIPVTDTFEAGARGEVIKAQLLAAATDLELKQMALSDVTGLSPSAMQLLFPGNDSGPREASALNQWLTETADRNVQLCTYVARTELAVEESAKFSLASSPTSERCRMLPASGRRTNLR